MAPVDLEHRQQERGRKANTGVTYDDGCVASAGTAEFHARQLGLRFQPEPQGSRRRTQAY